MSKYREVTPEQYRQGWLRFLDTPTPMILVKKLSNGNYIVKNPEPKEKQ